VQKSTQATSDVQNINVSTTNSFAHNRQERLNGGQTGFSLNGHAVTKLLLFTY